MQLLFIGAVAFFIAGQLIKWATPFYIQMRLRKWVKNQPVKFYRQQLKAQRKLMHLRRIENNTREMMLTGLMMCALFMTAPLLLAPYPSLSAIVIAVALWELSFYGKLWIARRLPLYTFISINDELIFFHRMRIENSKEPEYKHKLRISNEKMVRTNVLKEFVPAKKLAIDLMELDASIEDADKVIRDMRQAGVDAKDVQEVRQQAIDLSASIKERLSVYPELLLHLLDASTLSYKQAKEKEEAGERATANMLKAIQKLSDVKEAPVIGIVRNPAVEDMVRIIESEEVDSETKAYAEKTLREIQERMNREAEEKEVMNTLSNALASIQTARKVYRLDSEEASAS